MAALQLAVYLTADRAYYAGTVHVRDLGGCGRHRAMVCLAATVAPRCQPQLAGARHCSVMDQTTLQLMALPHPAGVVMRRYFNNIATNCADPSRSDFHQRWCDSFRSQCEQLRNTTGAAQAAVRERGRVFLGAEIDLPCETWKGEHVALQSHPTVCTGATMQLDGAWRESHNVMQAA